MRIRWTSTARQDLRGIRAYIARDSGYYASAFVARIVEAAETLVRFPNKGRKVPEAEDEAVRELIFHSYRIIYVIADDEIQISTVIHTARDLSHLEPKPWEVD